MCSRPSDWRRPTVGWKMWNGRAKWLHAATSAQRISACVTTMALISWKTWHGLVRPISADILWWLWFTGGSAARRFNLMSHLLNETVSETEFVYCMRVCVCAFSTLMLVVWHGLQILCEWNKARPLGHPCSVSLAMAYSLPSAFLRHVSQYTWVRWYQTFMLKWTWSTQPSSRTLTSMILGWLAVLLGCPIHKAEPTHFPHLSIMSPHCTDEATTGFLATCICWC